MRVIQVGCGLISGRWLDAIRAHGDLEPVALVDVDQDAAREAAASRGFDVPIFADAHDALANVAADVVFDCTPPKVHRDVTLAALGAGRHVFGEKPMAEEMDEARAMVDAAHASGKTYAVMQNRRFDPNIRALRAFIESGAIGRLTTVDAEFYISPHFGGFRETMNHVLLLDMAIHTFDAARFLTGANAEAVYCHEWNPRGSWYAHGASASAIFEMTDGIVFNYLGSWCAEGLHTAWEGSWRLIGERGSITWDGATGLRCQVVEGSGAFINNQVDIPGPKLVEGEPDTWHDRAIRDFVDKISRSATPETVCDDNIHSLAMVLGAIESSKRGARVASPLMETTT
ncbi:Gfo/Idh/MocA family protein [Bauldia sp.]|uniref:Gfo/Idh/MocA family protein n=1 Tax=Bauldia sp. TaxID=2575872 RepID=UPI003BA8C6E4